MKGIVLAGGFGTRLLPMTRVTNKHLLPVYDRPMVYFPIECLCRAGVTEIMLVTGGECAGDFVELLGNGQALGLTELAYAYQEGARGIADALSMAEDFADGGPIIVALGDNLVEQPIDAHVEAFRHQLDERGGKGARILLKEVENPSRFGVARFEGGDHRLVEIIEKPQDPPSHSAVIGIYMYGPGVFDIIRTLTPSDRDELEITDVNNAYLKEGQLEYSTIEGWWSDAGTIESLHRASCLVADQGANGEGPARAKSGSVRNPRP